ncbi:MAG: glycosyltransferase family 39 protein [Chloroflexota bacterium]
MKNSLPNGRLALILIFLCLLIWLPRGLALDRFVTADEHAWVTRSGNFYRAIALGNYAETFQRHHPGVTVTWAGALGFLWTYPSYATDAQKNFGWLTEEIEPFLQKQGYRPITLLAAGRGIIVIAITLSLLACFGPVRRLFGSRTAFISIGLIALSPFHIALSRLMHLDGLLSTFMLLSLLAFMVHMKVGEPSSSPWPTRANTGSRNATNQTYSGWLLLSAITAGLAWLTRSPGLFLAPFMMLILLVRSFVQGELNKQSLMNGIISLVLWGGMALLTFIALWPAMWVAPLESMTRVLSAAGSYAAEGHLKPIFFNGQVHSGDPGWTFYPMVYLWRTTPITLFGLGLALLGLIFRNGGQQPRLQPSLKAEGATTDIQHTIKPAVAAQSGEALALVSLLIYAVLFGLFMSIGAKKFDRYLLPAFLPLGLIAGWGWANAITWSSRWVSQFGEGDYGSNVQPSLISRSLKWLSATKTSGSDHSPLIALALMMLVLLGQASFALPTYPYYLSYYNPLMGGASKAPQVMQIGWGEGADQAATFLREAITPAPKRVASAYTNGPFSYFFPGETLPIYFWDEADYAVLYAQDFQRRLPGPRQIRAFEQSMPIQTVSQNGIEYARIYDVKANPLPDYVTEWRLTNDGDVNIRLVSYLFPSSTIAQGETLPMTLYFRGVASLDVNLNVLVRLVGHDGAELVRSEGWPWGAPTSTWQSGDVWPDGHALTIPEDTQPGPYRLDVTFYDPVTQQRLTAIRSATGEILGDSLALDFVEIGPGSTIPTRKIQPNTMVGQFVEILGSHWGSEEETSRQAEGEAIRPGDGVALRLFWHTIDHTSTNYTTFVHIVGPDGVLLTQRDEEPWGGFYPTSFWHKGRTIRQPIPIQIPTDAAPGSYAIHIGMYERETLQRLPITQNGGFIGDSYITGRLLVDR